MPTPSPLHRGKHSWPDTIPATSEHENGEGYCHGTESLFSQKNGWVLFLISVLVLIIYSNTFHASWHFDDFGNVNGNPKINISDLYPDTLKQALYASPTSGNRADPPLYRPVAMLSFAINWYIGQDDPFGYHVVNTLIHIVTAFFLYQVILLILSTPNVKPMGASTRFQIALLSSVLWAIHPIQTQAVTYIVQRMAAMAAMFYIAGIFFYLKARNAVTTREEQTEMGCTVYPSLSRRLKPLGFGVCCLCMYLLSAGSKENGFLMPLSILLIDITFFQNISHQNRRRWIYIAGGCLFSIALLLIGTQIFYDGPLFSFLNGYSHRSFTLAERLLTEPRVICLYLYQIIYPVVTQFSLEHDIALSRSIFSPWTTLPAILFLGATLTTGLFLIRKRPLISFAILFYFLNHLIESTVIPLELVFEHRNYLPTLFLFLPVAGYIVPWLQNYRHDPAKPLQWICFTLIGSTLLIILGMGTYTRNFDWLSEKSLWESAIRKAPDIARPYQNLAVSHYQKTGQFDIALALHEKALTLNDSKPAQAKMTSYNHMSNIHRACKNREAALAFSKKAVEAAPNNDMILNYIINLVESDHLESATNETTAFIDKNPSDLTAHNLLTYIFLKSRQTDLAYQSAIEAMKIDPFDRQSIYYMGLAAMYAQKHDKANHYLEKVATDPLSGTTRLQIYLALIHNAVQWKKTDKVDLYTRKTIEQFNVTAIMKEIESIHRERYPMLHFTLNRVLHEISNQFERSAQKLKMSMK